MSQLSAVIELCKKYNYVDGQKAILEMKENSGRNWRQTEWIGWYYEFLIDKFDFRNKIPYISPTGRKTYLDYRLDSILTDLKTHIINSSSGIILNDKKVLEDAIEKEGKIQILLLNGNANKDDSDRSFQKWHCNLAKSEFNPKGRIRKIDFELLSIYLLEINKNNKNKLSIMKQGKNSNGKPRPEKFIIKDKDIQYFCLEEINIL